MTKDSPNRLAQESSPYLQQHAHNPVDWYPWAKEALDRSKREQKPIFLSIGYSACHWCHVMEKESFEDPETAALMNEHFVNIKVDREERQDLDHIYMNAVQVMTQHGGWPMSVFLTPELEPFYGGTYFPPEDRMGMPGFKKILSGVANAWQGRREEVVRSAKQLVSALSGLSETTGGPDTASPPSYETIEAVVRAIKQNYDSKFGGFGAAPKFFHTMALRVCLRHWKRTGDADALGIATSTLERLRNGGIYDQLGGGFHRYSTDQQWLVPHFEKMLYDNALLAVTYLEAFQATGNQEFAKTATDTLDYVLREMTSSEGGFFSTQDADTEGEEGKFYVWSREEIEGHLQKELADTFCSAYGVDAGGNWEGHTILNRVASTETIARQADLDPRWTEEMLATAKRKLLAERGKRERPFRDEKILMSWNGMMIEAMAKGYQVLGDERFLRAATRAADFILAKLRSPAETSAGTPMFFHVFKDGKSRFTAYLDDYAHMANALVSLYESDFQIRWLESARSIMTTLLDQFFEDAGKSFFFTGRDHEKLITRPKEIHDGATPSGTAMAVTALARLGKLTGHTEYLTRAYSVLQSHHALVRSLPTAMAQMAIALELMLDQAQEIVVAPGEQNDEFDRALRTLRGHFLPNAVFAVHAESNSKLIPGLNGKPAVGGRTTVYVCQGFSCQSPLVGIEALERALTKMGGRERLR